jgi:phosphoribosylanthranilate isomerase
MDVKIKICGITRVDDARAAVDAGVDMVGLMFCETSPRHVTLAQAAEIASHLPPHILRVGVFVDSEEEFVLAAARQCGLGLLQFHGKEDAAFCTQFGLMSMKAFRIRDEASLDQLSNYTTDAFLLDSYVPGKAGGTGERFNWSLAVRAKQWRRPIFLAGGLTAQNVAEAVRMVEPFAVDVSSGVESAPGVKDPVKMRDFIQAVRHA